MNSIFGYNTNLKKYIKTKLNEEKYNKKQDEREETTWIGILFSALEFYLLFYLGLLPSISSIPFFTFESFIICLISHLLPVEFIYYWVHRLMHHPSIYSSLHKHHHLSIITTPKTSVTIAI